jgi:hypothetical protein
MKILKLPAVFSLTFPSFPLRGIVSLLYKFNLGFWLLVHKHYHSFFPFLLCFLVDSFGAGYLTGDPPLLY